MASTLDFVTYVVGQLAGAGEITYRKMFGEYAVYLDGKYLVAVCDNQVFVKQTTAGRELLGKKEAIVEAAPYEGAKPAFRIDDLEDQTFLKQLLQATWKEIPASKPKKKKEQNESQ